jgi:hypothetical protein
VGLEDVVVEVLRLLGTAVDGRRLTIAARGHRVELDVAGVSVRPPSVRPVAPAAASPPPASPSWPGLSWSAWADAVPEWVDWSRWMELSPWSSPPAGSAGPLGAAGAGWSSSRSGEASWPALGRIALALRDVAVDGRIPFEVLDVSAAEVAVELANPPTLVARDLGLRVEASCPALEAWLPPDLTVRARTDGRLGATRRGWGRVGELPVTLSVAEGLLQLDIDGVEVRGIRLQAPRRWRRRQRLDPAGYHPGLRFEHVDVDAASGRVRARLHLAEWREPVSFEQLGDLRARLTRRAPVTLRSLLGG